MKTKSNIEKILESGGFVVTSECGPPRGADPEVIRKKGNLLKGVVDAVNVTDNQTSVVRMSSSRRVSSLKKWALILYCRWSVGIGTGSRSRATSWEQEH